LHAWGKQKGKFLDTRFPVIPTVLLGTLFLAPAFFVGYVLPALGILFAVAIVEFLVRKTIKAFFAAIGSGRRANQSRREAALNAKQAEESERQAAERSRRDGDARQRRDEARSECLLYFQLHSPELSDRFGRQQFDEYVRFYMGDDKPPEEVERRAQRLIGLMDGHLEKAGAKAQPMDVAALARWYQETKAQIEALPVDDRAKRVQVAQLTARYTELVQQHLEELKP
jgi:hypothetical protein